MPREKDGYAVGYKVFFHTAIAGRDYMESMLIPGSCQCWHTTCPVVKAWPGECSLATKGGLWTSHQYVPGRFTEALWPDEAPLTIFAHSEHALAFIMEYGDSGLELWEVSYVPGTKPEMRAGAKLPRGTEWARVVRPDKLIGTLRELRERHEEGD